MSLLHPYTGDETKAEAPIDQDLMDLKIRENLEDLAVQIDNIGGGGGGGAASTGAIGEILSGGKNNKPVYWKRRFHPFEHMLNPESENPSGFDPESRNATNSLLSFIQSNDTGHSSFSDSRDYLGQSLRIAKSSKLSFKIKSGVNFFGIVHTRANNQSDNVVVLIDGQTPSSLGLVDENGNAAPDTFSTFSATAFYQHPIFFYGLDGDEHIVTLENDDSASKFLNISAVEVGYKTNNPTINETLNVKSGRANIKGTEVSFDETDLTFGELDKNGHTGSVVCNTAGTLSVLNGMSPANTQAKPEIEINFASGPVSSIDVKNNFYFPDNGILLVSTPYGAHFLASYNSKTDTTIQTHSFDGLVWQSQPTESFTPLDSFDGAASTGTGDININLWASAPIEINSTNNKIDFEITVNGVTTQHSATVENGRYSADLVPLDNAINKAMQFVKPIDGRYSAEYNKESQLWTIFVTDDEVDKIDFLFSTGANTATSIHPVIGFDTTDLIDEKSYLATNELQHLACRVFEKDPVYMSAEDPRIKYGFTGSVTGSAEADIEDRLNVPPFRRLSGDRLMQIFVDADCCGLELNFSKHYFNQMVTVQIDDGQLMYLLNPQDGSAVTTNIRNKLMTAFISFPRGSKKISIRDEGSSVFEIYDDANEIRFAGARQYFTKPAWEKLTKSEAILETIDISPVSLYATIYGHNGGSLYSPAAQDDNINTIIETGSWANSGLNNTFFNGATRSSNTNGDYVDINFTLQGDGGGFFMKSAPNASGSTKISMYLSAAAIIEATDLIQNNHQAWGVQYFDQDTLKIIGLPNGTYNLRVKKIASGFLDHIALGIIDTVPPQENANTLSDINNTGQGVCYPVNVIREQVMQDSGDRVPTWLERSGYKEDVVTKVNYSINSPSWSNLDDTATLVTNGVDGYFGAWLSENVNGASMSFSGFMKSYSVMDRCFTSNTTSLQPFINGVQTLNNYSQANQVKGGSAPSSARQSRVATTQKLFKLSCSFSSGDTFNLNDTRGIKIGKSIILDDGTNKENATVLSVVNGVSFTVKKARNIVVDANVVEAQYQGFHSISINTNDASTWETYGFEYEPLTISPSKSIRRMNQDFKYEKVGVTHKGIPSGGDIYYPVHSDGVVGNWTTSTIEVIGCNGGAYRLDQDLKNITTTGDLDIKITSERLVPVFDETERF